MKPAYEFKDKVRGEIREGGETLSFEFAPGPVPEDIDPRVQAHLVALGVAVDPAAQPDIPAEQPAEVSEEETRKGTKR